MNVGTAGGIVGGAADGAGTVDGIPNVGAMATDLGGLGTGWETGVGFVVCK